MPDSTPHPSIIVLKWIVGGGFTFLSAAIVFVWGYMKLFLKVKWEEADVKKSKLDREDILREIDAIVNNTSIRLDAKTEANIKSINDIESDVKCISTALIKNSDELHKRINDEKRDSDKEFRNLEKSIQTIHESTTKLLGEIQASIAKQQATLEFLTKQSN